MNEFTSLFKPAAISKSYIKKFKGGLKSTNKCLPINEDLSSLYNYITAANIRKKVKNPIFLAFRFPECFHLYYSSPEKLDSPPKEIELIDIALEGIGDGDQKLKLICSIKVEHNAESFSMFNKVTDLLLPLKSRTL